MGTTAGGGGRRARERNAELTRTRVLDGAMAEFTARGFAGARIDAIAERAGVNVRSIYQHFESKATLFDAVLGDSVRRRHEQLLGEIGPLLATERGFAELFPLFRRVLADSPGWARLMAWKELSEELDVGVGEIYSATDRQALYRRETELFDAARARGAIPGGLDSDLLLLALTALAAFPWFVRPLTMLVTGTPPESAEFYRRWDAFLGALGQALVGDGGPRADASASRHRELRVLGRALDRAGLAGPLGHCSLRLDPERLLATGPRPLRLLTDEPGVVVPVAGPLPGEVPPPLAHDQAVYRARPDVGAIGTLEPASVRALVATGRAATLVPCVAGDDPAELVAALGDGPVVLRADGGAVVVADTAGRALAQADELARAAAAALHGPGVVVRTDWSGGRAERVWAYLTAGDPEVPGPG